MLSWRTLPVPAQWTQQFSAVHLDDSRSSCFNALQILISVQMLWHPMLRLKPWQIFSHFPHSEAKPDWLFAHCASLGDVTVVLSRGGKTSKWLKSGKWNGRAPSCSAALSDFYLHFIPHLYFRCFARISCAGEVHVYKQRKKVKFLHTDISR